MLFPIEPRTHLDMMRELLAIVEAEEWISYWSSRYTEMIYDCRECDGDPKTGHKPDCKFVALITECNAYIQVEETLAYERENSK